MWKSIGNIKNDDAASVRSNRSRNEINLEPFHHKIKHAPNEIPNTNRSFCRQYFQKKRNKTLNHSIALNKSQGNISSLNNNKSVELRKKGSKDEQGSKAVDKAKQVSDEQNYRKNYEQIKKASSKMHNLKKDQAKLKNSVQNEFQSLRNMFYQLQQQVHESQNQTQPQPTKTQSLDLDFFKEILSEAVGIQLYFQQMERKKAALMQKLAQ